MKSLASLKAVPYIGLAVVAIIKGLKNRKEGANKLQVIDKNQNVYLEGKITKNLKDSFGYISQISTPTASLWVVSENELPPVGQDVGFELGKRFDAYESVQLGMAFERVNFISKMGLISEHGNGSD
jgi:hypothetical protein